MRPRNEIAVGIMFFAAMGILAYFTIIKRDLFDTRDYYNMTALFTNVEGMELGNKVMVNGVESGKVTEIRLSGNRVIVTMRLFNQFTLYENYSITMKSASMLGGKFISIFPGTPFVEGESQAVVTARENLIGFATGDPVEMVSILIDENREDINATIGNIRDITEKINSGQGTLGRLVNDDSIHARTDDLIVELRESLEDAREQAPITSFIRAAITFF